MHQGLRSHPTHHIKIGLKMYADPKSANETCLTLDTIEKQVILRGANKQRHQNRAFSFDNIFPP